MLLPTSFSVITLNGSINSFAFSPELFCFLSQSNILLFIDFYTVEHKSNVCKRLIVIQRIMISYSTSSKSHYRKIYKAFASAIFFRINTFGTQKNFSYSGQYI